MSQPGTRSKSASRFNFMDVLLYTLAGSAMTFISITFLLWLRF